MRLKYRIHINLLIVVMQTVLRWYTGEVEDKDIRFHNSSHLNKLVSNSIGCNGHGRCSYGIEGVYDLKQREYQTVIFTDGPVTPKSVPPKSGPPGPIFAKKMVPRTNFGSQNRSPRIDFGSQNWSPPAKNSPPTDHDARTEFGSPD